MTSVFSANAAAIVTHLVVSTIVLLIALVAARAIPLTARTRHALLFGGLLKFALPSSFIVVPLRWIGLDLEGERIAAATYKVLGAGGPPAGAVVATVSGSWPEMLGVMWVGMAVLLLVIGWLTHARAVAGALRGATPASPREASSLAAARERLGRRASPKTTDDGPYSVQVDARKLAGDQISVHIRARSKATSEVVFDPTVTVSTGRPGAVTRQVDDQDLHANVFASSPGQVKVEFSVSRQGRTIEKLSITPVVTGRSQRRTTPATRSPCN